ncbi:MAG: hypothetical protein Q8L27_03660 [archaeon]|nr:hypothetical protein [archaeon]
MDKNLKKDCAVRPIKESGLNEKEIRVLRDLQQLFPGKTFYHCQNIDLLTGKAHCDDYVALNIGMGVCGYEGLKVIDRLKQLEQGN